MSQGDFGAALLDPDRPVPAGITDPEGRPAPRRFNVYRNNVTVSLTEALRQAFPVIRRLLGEEFFAAMAREHLRAHPPASPMLMHYGQDLPAFLAGFPPVAHLGYLADVARLELALRQSYHAADTQALPADALAELPPDRFMAARLTLAPAVMLVRSNWPIHAIWAANMLDQPPPRAAQAQDVLITRPAFDPLPHLLPAGAAPFVCALMQGRTLTEALAEGPEFDLTATLGLLMSGGAITALKTDEEPR